MLWTIEPPQHLGSIWMNLVSVLLQGTNAHAILSHMSANQSSQVSKQLPWARSRHWVLPSIGSFLSAVRAPQGPTAGCISMFEINLAGPDGSAFFDLAIGGQPTLTMALWTHLSSVAMSCISLDAPVAVAGTGPSRGMPASKPASAQKLLAKLTGGNMTLHASSGGLSIKTLAVCISVDHSHGSLKIQQQQGRTMSNIGGSSSNVVASCTVSSTVASPSATVAGTGHKATNPALQTWFSMLSSGPQPQGPMTVLGQTDLCSPADMGRCGMLATPRSIPRQMAAWEASVQAINIAQSTELGPLPAGRLPQAADAWLGPRGSLSSFQTAAVGTGMGLGDSPASAKVAAVTTIAQAEWTAEGSSSQAGARGLLMHAIQPQHAMRQGPNHASYRTIWTAQEPALQPQQHMQGMHDPLTPLSRSQMSASEPSL